MRPLNKALIVALVVSTSSFGAQVTRWAKRAISDSLSPASDRNSCPCAGASGIVWLSDQHWALAVWDRHETRYITPLDSRSAIRDPCLWGQEVAYSGQGYPWQAEVFYWREGDSHQITYNSIDDAHPSLFGGNIAWDNRSPMFGPSPPIPDHSAAVSDLSASAIVAWSYPWPSVPDDSEIWFWNGYGAWQVTDNDVEDAFPSLYELTIAWESDGKVVYATMPDPEWGLPLAPTTVAEGERPSLFGHKIAYSASHGADFEIFLYDIKSRETIQITDNNLPDRYPRLYDGTLVWMGYDGGDWEIFYWDGKTSQQLTDDDIWQTDPTLWGTGLNTTIAYVEWWSDMGLDSRIVCLRPAVTMSAGPGSGDFMLTWPSLEDRTYRVEYTDDLVNWRVAADAVPSAGYGETSWTDGLGSGTVPPPCAVSRRFYRVCENE